jgi:hypothetical protein
MTSNIEKFKRFMQRYNMYSQRAPSRNLTQAAWQTFGSEIVTAAYQQYFDNANEYRGIRPSNAYKPAIAHVLQKFGYCHSDERIKWNRAYAPFIGHVTEALVVLLLTEANVPFTRGTSMSILGGAMSGTADIIIDDLVIDIKSMNGTYFRKFTDAPDDERGYITQLHLYANALGTHNMGVLALCKDYPSISFMPLGYSSECIDSVKRRVDMINAATSVSDIRHCPIPPLYAGRGNTLNVPPSLKYCESKHLLYKLTDPDSEFCCTAYGARTHDEILELLADVPDAVPPIDDNLIYPETDIPY